MNNKQIKYALALSEALNFSQVAEEFGISQPALSKQIQHLENELGVKLFDRNRNPLRLTPAGEYFIHSAREILYKEDQLKKTLEQFNSGESGQLVIGITPFRSQYIMPSLVKKFRAKYPNVSVIVKEVTSAQLRKDAAEGKYDLAIVNLPVDNSLLDIIPLEKDTLVLAVPRSMTEKLPLYDGCAYPEIEFSQVKHLPFVVMTKGREMRELFDGLCAEADFHPTVASEVMGVTSAWAMAEEGVGATLLPLQFLHNRNLDRNLSVYIVKNSIFSRQPVVATRRGQFLSHYAEYMIRLLTEEE